LTFTRRYPAATSASTLSRSAAAAAQELPERHALAARPQLPDRHLERGLRHLVPAHSGEGGEHLARVADRERKGHRGEELAQDVKRGDVGLGKVEGVDVGHALGVAAHAAGGDRDEQELLGGRAAE
jgi:hypothetical protein